mgnify:CR=1 FL=1
MGQSDGRRVYLEILERSWDPVALRLGILLSDQFSEEIKERARAAATMEALRSLLAEQRAFCESASGSPSGGPPSPHPAS